MRPSMRGLHYIHTHTYILNEPTVVIVQLK